MSLLTLCERAKRESTFLRRCVGIETIAVFSFEVFASCFGGVSYRLFALLDMSTRAHFR